MAHATTCRRCSGPMDGRGPTAVFCSRTCNSAASKENERARMLAIDRTCEQCGCTFHSPVGDPPTSKRYPRLCGPRCVGESQRTNWPASRVHFAACADCGRVERLDGPRLARDWRCAAHQHYPATRVYFAACAACGKVERVDRSRSASEWRCEIHQPWPSCAVTIGRCVECDGTFARRFNGTDARFCSVDCSKRSHNRNHDHRRRARKSGGEPIWRRKVYDRDGGRCHICRKSIDWTLEYPHPQSFSLDHVVPLSKGGEHAYANVKAAHWLCNALKSDNAVESGEQLMLIG